MTDEVDIDAWSEDADITIRLVQAIAAACKAEPSLNAWFNSEAEGMTLAAPHRRRHRCRS